MKTIFDLGSKVKINFDKIEIEKDKLKEIRSFDEKYNGVHTVTEIRCKKDKETDKEIIQISLEDDFFFYEKEIILLKDKANTGIEKPYLEEIEVNTIRKYNPNYGDNRICECGHPYYRHFDSYEDMYPCGCKYCGCDEFKEKK